MTSERAPHHVSVPPIDLVYPWVDGDDPALRADVERYAENAGDSNPERTRDLHDVLRYSLRSVDRFVPWIRKVFIVTRRPQVPRWLDVANERVTVVHHDQLHGFAPFLPTFNSTVIESFTHEIRGLSDHYLLMNDDFLFGSPIEPGDFLTPEGKHRVFGTYFGIRLPFRIYRDRWRFWTGSALEHSPRFIYKQYWKEMLDSKPAAVLRTRSNRFRRGSDLRMDRMYRMWMLGPGRGAASPVLAREFRTFSRFHKIVNKPNKQRDRLKKIEDMRPKFLCLNDDQGPDPNSEVVALVQAFLDRYYPEPSQFERSSA
jgi:hypothetical protein